MSNTFLLYSFKIFSTIYFSGMSTWEAFLTVDLNSQSCRRMNQETGWRVAHLLCLPACIKFTCQGFRAEFLSYDGYCVYGLWRLFTSYIFIAISLDIFQSKYIVGKYSGWNKYLVQKVWLLFSLKVRKKFFTPREFLIQFCFVSREPKAMLGICVS